MKVIEHINNAKKTLLSIEIVPPMRGGNIQSITGVVKMMEPFKPSWIDVTAHSSSAIYNEKGDGSVERKIFKKRPGTLGICGIIQNKFKIDTVAHLLCQGFTKEETEDALIELNFLGVQNVLAIKGDGLNYEKSYAKDRSVNVHASDLVDQIVHMREGHFLADLNNAKCLDFGVGVAGYPEKHFEAPNLKTDIQFLKAKIDKGAEYIVTQMFFDNKVYFNFVKECRAAGITVPIVPGLKVLKSLKQISNLPSHFYISLPDELVDEVMKNPENVEQIGINWAIKQCEELLKHNVPSLHFYVMNEAKSVVEVIKRLNY